MNSLIAHIQQQMMKPKMLSNGLQALFLVPLLVILAISNWANVTINSAAIILIMVVSLLIGLHKLANQIASVIEKGADNHFR
ncbi:hypothetical protein [Lentilactobacillus kisonensis]|nr:hypothetical protein [Lentilactobacillus kisonensis]KRL20273.1 hypothetical protein FC98_GL001776 [Lentilactobacillus kisonensis DSM 19906 = JCM 15041]